VMPAIEVARNARRVPFSDDIVLLSTAIVTALESRDQGAFGGPVQALNLPDGHFVCTCPPENVRAVRDDGHLGTRRQSGGPIEGDATGEELLKSYIREDYATLLSTLDERHAIVFGGRRPARSRSWSGPTRRRNRPAPVRRGQDSEARMRPSQAKPARLASPGCAADSG
jgi:hypothetical protein